MAKTKSKYISFAKQREWCRLNKYTYTEKCGCGVISLMCNYPFDVSSHKKGMCRASTCTDMRKQVAEDVNEILSEETPRTEESVPTVCSREDERIIETQEEDPKGAVRAE
jgi:hypothetical protein